VPSAAPPSVTWVRFRGSQFGALAHAAPPQGDACQPERAADALPARRRDAFFLNPNRLGPLKPLGPVCGASFHGGVRETAEAPACGLLPFEPAHLDSALKASRIHVLERCVP
jgi:hypothetical protein